jgi:integrase/recombinase XerD
MEAGFLLFSDLCGDYIRHIKYERGLAQDTVVGYTSWLRNYQAWLKAEGYPDPPTLDQFTAPILRKYQHYHAERHLRPRTMLSVFHPLRGMGDYLVAQKIIDTNPVRALTMPKKDSPDQNFVSDDELAKLLEATKRQRDKVKAAFELALFSTLIFVGIRAQELLDLKLDHLRLDEGKLTVIHGKGGKTRTLFLCEEALCAIRDWIAVRPEASHDWVWSQNRGRRISYDNLLRIFAEVKARAGLADAHWIKPHACRRALATRLMIGNANIREIQGVLGHSDAATTLVYLRQLDEPAKVMTKLAGLRVGDKSPALPSPPPKPSRAETISRMRRRSAPGGR